MRKRVSKRRWKARFKIGKWIPLEAIYNHRLERLVAGAERHAMCEMYRKSK